MSPAQAPDGCGRPPLLAVLREATVVAETSRFALRRGASRTLVRRAVSAAPVVRRPEPVLLIPGFLAGDWMLAAIAGDLRGQGFRTYRSHIRANLSCSATSVLGLEERLEQIAERRGAKVHLLGHSLGGVVARGLADRRPDLVASLVTMASPLRSTAAHHAMLGPGLKMLTRLSQAGVADLLTTDCVAGSCAHLDPAEARRPLPHGIAMTNFYSRSDGVVDWRACIDPEGEPVEVRASHAGMVLDPRVLDVVTATVVRQSAMPQRGLAVVETA